MGWSREERGVHRLGELIYYKGTLTPLLKLELHQQGHWDSNSSCRPAETLSTVPTVLGVPTTQESEGSTWSSPELVQWIEDIVNETGRLPDFRTDQVQT